MSPHEAAEPADAGPADEPIKAPGFAAMLRRHPQAKRQAAFGSIAVGIALFVVASMTTQLAGAQPSHPEPRAAAPATSAPVDLGALLPLAGGSTPPTASAPTTAKKVLKAKPAHVRKAAPVSTAVISGLASNGIPNVALNAYRVAAARMNNSDPGCGIDWSLLAGIGREESDHGRFGGATLATDGTSSPRIIGPALDGKNWDYIPAPSDGLALDSDALYAHALGPMQFIPQTWASYGADANGDGVADIFNINDAALGAARYLCAAGGNLRTHGGQVAAVLAYNHSDQYLAQVLALADAYHRGVPISGIPLGNITGKVDPVNSTDVPPANPGGPTAVDTSTSHKKAAHKKATSKTKTGKSKTGKTKTRSTKGGTSKPGTTKSTAPKPSTGPSSKPSKTTAPSTAPTKGSGSGSPTGGTTSSPSPSPTPTKKCVLWNLQHTRCMVYSL